MTGQARLSIIVVSRHRPALLARCLAALSRQDHPEVEVILVADPASLLVQPGLPLKRIEFDQPNISMARNLGLGAAAGQVVAFIDDDALALPHWARRIAAPFHDQRILAATGFTRGPDGLNWQAQAERITPDGVCVPIQIEDVAQDWVALPVEQGCPVSTIGTNCAFRSSALRQIGGFDPAFPYFLDESDVNMRLADRFPQLMTAVVPHAEVIHGIAAGPIRAGAGVPRDLSQIGRSAMVFTRRHGGTLAALERQQRQKLLRHMVAGRLDPFAIAPLLAGFSQGAAEGRAAADPPWPASVDAVPNPFLPLSANRPRDRKPVILQGWYWQRHQLRDIARQAVQAGETACLLLLTPTALPHRLILTSGGWWEQNGGIWGAKGPQASRPGGQLFRGGRGLYPEFEQAMSRRF